MSQMMIHLVGSIPFRNPAEVFERVGSVLGRRLYAIPDGETGERLTWVGWLEQIFARHPQFAPADQRFIVRPGGKEVSTMYRLKPDVTADTVRFDALPFTRIALESYRDFEEARRRGHIPKQVRFQVTLAGPLSVIRRFVTEDTDHAAMLAAYEAGLMQEVGRIAAAIPHERLAVQWDVASAVFERLERGEPNAYGTTREEMMQAFVRWHLNIGMAVPPDVHLMYHLCYGDADHKHSIEPSSTGYLVEFANRISAEIGRTIELIHMPVPRNRSDDAYFAPLAGLKLRPETKLALGLVHYTDGVEGTRKRVAAARKYVDDFAIATECGFGRRPPETVDRLMQIHAEVAEAR